MKQLQEENARLKRLVADLTLDDAAGRAVKKILKPWPRPVVKHWCGIYGISKRRACRVGRMNQGTNRYRSHKDPGTELRMRIREFAQARVRYRYRKILALLHREGWKVGRSPVYRL